MVVEGKPRDVDFARRLEDAWWNIIAAAVASYHDVRRIRAVEFFVRAEKQEKREEDSGY